MAGNIIREATLADVADMAEIFAAGFIDDDVFGRFMHPKRHEYLEDWIRYWHRDMRRHVLEPRGKCFVCANDSGQVMGCVIMQRLGKGGDALAASESYSHMIERKLWAADEAVDNFTSTDRSADPKAIEAFEQNWEDIQHHFSGPRAECWMIELLCIHPDAQAKGAGRAIIEHAIDLCKSEETPVPLAVIASDIGDAFYERMGFREAGRANVGGMSGVRGGSLKFYEQHLLQEKSG